MRSEDITDQLDAEQALRDALAVEREAVERLRDVDAVMDQVVSTVSHGLRVQTHSQRLLVPVDDLLTLSRVAERAAGSATPASESRRRRSETS